MAAETIKQQQQTLAKLAEQIDSIDDTLNEIKLKLGTFNGSRFSELDFNVRMLNKEDEEDKRNQQIAIQQMKNAVTTFRFGIALAVIAATLSSLISVIVNHSTFNQNHATPTTGSESKRV
jgi:hypothetical protein